MIEIRPDRVECILGQGYVVLGGGLAGIGIDEETAGTIRDLCLPIVEEFADDWTSVAPRVWGVVHEIGVEIASTHSGSGEVTADEFLSAMWKVVGSRESPICLRLKERLQQLGHFPPPPAM